MWGVWVQAVSLNVIYSPISNIAMPWQVYCWGSCPQETPFQLSTQHSTEKCGSYIKELLVSYNFYQRHISHSYFVMSSYSVAPKTKKCVISYYQLKYVLSGYSYLATQAGIVIYACENIRMGPLLTRKSAPELVAHSLWILDKHGISWQTTKELDPTDGGTGTPIHEIFKSLLEQ